MEFHRFNSRFNPRFDYLYKMYLLPRLLNRLTTPQESDLGSHSQSSKSPDGFTLIEILVVLVIVGVLSAIVAPSWLGFLNNQRLGTSRDLLFRTINQARSLAKRDSTPTTVVIGVTNSRYWITTNRTQSQYDTAGTTSQYQYFEEGVEVSGLKQGTSAVTTLTAASFPIGLTFDGTGMPKGTKIPANALNPNAATVSFTTPTVRLPYRLILRHRNLGPGSNRCLAISTVLGAMTNDSGAACNS